MNHPSHSLRPREASPWSSARELPGPEHPCAAEHRATCRAGKGPEDPCPGRCWEPLRAGGQGTRVLLSPHHQRSPPGPTRPPRTHTPPWIPTQDSHGPAVAEGALLLKKRAGPPEHWWLCLLQRGLQGVEQGPGAHLQDGRESSEGWGRGAGGRLLLWGAACPPRPPLRTAGMGCPQWVCVAAGQEFLLEPQFPPRHHQGTESDSTWQSSSHSTWSRLAGAAGAPGCRVGLGRCLHRQGGGCGWASRLSPRGGWARPGRAPVCAPPSQDAIEDGPPQPSTAPRGQRSPWPSACLSGPGLCPGRASLHLPAPSQGPS